MKNIDKSFPRLEIFESYAFRMSEENERSVKCSPNGLLDTKGTLLLFFIDKEQTDKLVISSQYCTIQYSFI